MNILNVMWSGGSAFVSVHKVHRDILQLLGSEVHVETLLLQAGEAMPLTSIGQVSTLGLSSARIKGRGLESVRRFFDLKRMARLITRLSPQVVLIDGVGVATYLLPLLYKLTTIKIVVLFHGSKKMKGRDIALLKKISPERLGLVAVSATLATELELQIGCKVLAGRVALDPVEFRAALLARDVALKTLDLSLQQGLVIGAVGRLVPEKGFGLLIESAADWLRAHPHDRLVIVGEGVDRQRLTTLAQDLGVSSQVYLVGHHPRVQQLYLAFDLVCIPSQQEGLGLVLHEAVISDVPVLASDLPVFREQISGDAGLIPLDLEQWREMLCKVLSGDLKQLAETQRIGMDAEAARARYEGFYRQLLSC